MSDAYRDFIETVRAKSDILELVSGYVSLTRRGGKYWGCCPFHQEKTASFSVSPDKGFFYCFGCREGGDAISFVQKVENLQFREALSFMAGKYGIAVPDEQKSSFEREKEQQAKDIYQLNALAGDYFAACLRRSVFGQKVLSYLKERGVGEQTIEDFSLGASLQGEDKLYNALLKKGVNARAMVDARLVNERGGGRFNDFFRARLMIPIKDARGNVVGFGGRVVGQGMPKYLNTAESPWFNKRRLLYGLNVALPVIKQQGVALVVEGYMDTIALHAAGFGNVVASLGTAFSQEQAKLISRAAREVIFCYDSDAAGMKAAFAAISVARRENITVKALNVPDGKDPDEFILHNGKEAFAALLANAKEGFLFQKDYVLSQKDFSTLAGKVEVIENILPVIAELKNDIEVRRCISALSSELVIDESAIVTELNKFLSKHDKYGAKKVVVAGRSLQYRDANLLQRAQAQLLRAVFADRKLLAAIDGQLSEIGFSDDVYGEIYELAKKGLGQEQVFSLLSDEGKARLAEVLADESISSDVSKAAEDCLRQMKRAALERSYNEYRRLAEEYERLGDSKASLAYLVRCNEVNDEIKRLY